jgi:oligo-1,6-glucosidase
MSYIYKGTKNWWKEAVMYQIYPRSFNDSNGDGIGDLQGIIQKLDYLQHLGIDVIWCSPIYQSPNDDNGYDISDYRNIMTEFGSMGDFDEMLAGIHQRGMKLIMDLVVNHSSDEHDWFQQSRWSKDNPYRDYYIWKPPVNGGVPNDWESFFGGSAWKFDELTGEYFLHLFTEKQPDLNWENPKLRQEVYDLVKFWLDKGVDGFRMDVIPLISKFQDFPPKGERSFYELVEQTYANGPRVHEFLHEFYNEVLSKYDIMTVGEGIGVSTANANDYVGSDREELNMIFHFGHMFIDHGGGGRYDPGEMDFIAFKDIFTSWHEALGERGWVNIYLDNHDFPRMVSRFGNDKEYHNISGKLLATLIMTLRGTPCIYNGSEFGMTNVAFDNIEDYRDVETKNFLKIHLANGGEVEDFLKITHRQGRDNARTPIQWNGSDNAGFTTGTPWIKVNPNYPIINANAAIADENSILNYYRQLIELRKAMPILTYGDYQILGRTHPQVFAYTRSLDNEMVVVLLNMSDQAVQFETGLEISELNFVIGNYNKNEPQSGSIFDLQPWQAGIFRKNNS